MIIVLLILLQIKHFFCDGPFQTSYHLKKFLPFPDCVLPLASHSFVHAFGTFICFYFFVPIHLVISFSLIDFVIHFIVDWIKASPDLLGRFQVLSRSDFINISKGFSPYFHELSKRSGDVYLEVKMPWINDEEKQDLLKSNKYFWWSFLLDQMFHQLTYLFLAYLASLYF